MKQNLSGYANTAVYIVDYYYQIIIMTPICRTGEILTLCHLYSAGFLWPSKVCYEKYGCFYKHPGVHWGLITLRPKLPQSPYDVGTKFTMFTRSGSGEVNDFDRDLLRAAKFNISRRTISLIHGWQGR